MRRLSSRRLSSVIVPIFKLMAFAMGIFGTVLAFLGFEQPNLSRIIFFFIGCAVLTLHTRQWKNVYLQDGLLYVSGVGRGITVPLTEIARVEIVNARRVRLQLRNRTAFGRQIVFVPRWFGHKTPEIASELAHLVNRAKSRAVVRNPDRVLPKDPFAARPERKTNRGCDHLQVAASLIHSRVTIKTDFIGFGR